jgi:hypothetical protein
MQVPPSLEFLQERDREMKRSLTIVAALFCFVLPVSGFAQCPFGFTISGSATSPDVNSIPVTPGLQTVFLWLKCCNLPRDLPQGIAAAEFGLVSTNPDNVILAFTPAGSWLNVGSGTNLILAIGGCPCSFSLAGSILVSATAPGGLCLGPSLTGTMGGVDCSATPSVWPIEWIGLTFGGPPCGESKTCILSVDAQSWGSVKALYR